MKILGRSPFHRAFWRALAAGVLAVWLGAAQAAGMCMAPGASAAGSLLAAAGSVVGGLLGAAAGLLGGERSAGAGALECMPAEAASLPEAQGSQVAGNPVDVVSGAKLDRAIDVHLARSDLRAGLWAGPALELVFSRMYSSLGTGSEAFGPGWRHGFETRLHAGRDEHGEPQLQVLQADGRLVRFLNAADATAAGAGAPERYPALRYEDGLLERRLGSGTGSTPTEAVRAGADRTGWVWHWRDGRRLFFDVDGQLSEISGIRGERLRLARDPAGRLLSIGDATGQRLRLHYSTGQGDGPAGFGPVGMRSVPDGRVTALTLPDGSRIDYGYDRQGRLVRVLHPNGERVGYRYEQAGGSRLAAVVLPDGRRSEYRYDAAGRTVYSRAAGADETQALHLRYPNADGKVGETQLLRDGVLLASYRWRHQEDDTHARVVESSGAGCTQCPLTGVRYAYRAGQVVALERDGERWRLDRDGAGRFVGLTREVAGVVATAKADFRVEWRAEGTLDLPLRVIRPSVVPGREHVLQLEYGPTGEVIGLDESGYTPWIGSVDGALRILDVMPIRRRLAPPDRPIVGRPAGAMASPGAGRPLAGMPGLAQVHLPRDASREAHGRWSVGSAKGVRTQYLVDDFARPVAMVSPDRGLTRWRRDEHGRLLDEQVATGNRARHRHDDAGRLVAHSVSGPGAASREAQFRYANGRLVAVEHPEQSEHFAYDEQGRLQRRTVRLRLAAGQPVSIHTEYRYAGDGGLLQAQTLPDGSWLEWQRDPQGQVLALARRGLGNAPVPLAEGLRRSSDGLSSARLGNGVRVGIEHDPRGRPVRICHSGVPARDDACDLLDHRMAFDRAGRLLAWQRDDFLAQQLYDDAHRLRQSVEKDGRGEQRSLWRYSYDSNGNRLQAQHMSLGANLDREVNDGADLRADAGAAEAEANPMHQAQRGWQSPARSNRILAPESPGRGLAPAWDAAGHLLRDHRHRYRWNAMGLLDEVVGAKGTLARYRYSHRGERIASWSPAGWRYFVHDSQRRLLAELDGEGRITRQYIHLGDDPLAVIDRVGDDRVGGRERVVFLHSDHRGAPVLATDAWARPIWRVRHAPFGRLILTHAEPGFSLPLRLPGQYEDAATGLHYNDHRWYDPDTGRYLSPDPLGVRGGPNPYAYAGNDPLTRIDPSGLLLFAFDGTGNSDPPPGRDDWSNVYKLARAYADGRVWYMAGVGRPDTPSGIATAATDLADARSARERVDYMLGELMAVAAAPQWAGRWIDVDVIGFSRGAAMARDFANRVSERSAAGAFASLGSCVRLRFLGLWDTVAQFGIDGSLNAAWKLSIPSNVAYAAHAVALNEHRILFPVESIAGSTAAGVRIERGFIGAHSDIGGSYAEGDLSDVALGWMYAQAAVAGVRLLALTSEFARVTAPLLHDSSTRSWADREFLVRNSWGLALQRHLQRNAPVPGMRWQDTAAFIMRFDTAQPDAYGEPTLVGTVGMAGYSQWLSQHYGLQIGWTP